MRPAIRPGLQPVWRDDNTIQLGVDPHRAVAITGMTDAADVIALLDGSRERNAILADALRCGVSPEVTERVLSVLAAAGALIDYPAELLRSLPPELRQRLLPVLATASVSRADGDGGAAALARRAGTRVAVCGAGPVAQMLTGLLVQSGLAASARPPRRARPDLVVLVGRPRPEQARALQRRRLPHLVVLAAEATGVVGPLVLPGSSACLRCLDMTRAEHDPAWPRVLSQVAGPAGDPLACDPILAAAVAAQAASLVTAVADRAPLTLAAVNGTLELVLPGWQWRRRSWPPHPACGCCAAPGDPEPEPVPAEVPEPVMAGPAG